MLFPAEAALDALTQFKALATYATDLKVLTGIEERGKIEVATASYTQGNYEISFSDCRREIDELIARTSPYIWLEGESTQRHTFTEVSYDAETSNQAYLSLSTTSPPSSKLPYGAVYTFDVLRDGRYSIWLAGTVPSKHTSPITWYVNAEPAQPIADPRPIGVRYKAQQMGWVFLGNVNLKKGLNQRFTMRVEGPAADKEYRFGIDAVLMTTLPVAPNGVVRPLPVDIPVGQEAKATRSK
jgi:hypothetical protein